MDEWVNLSEKTRQGTENGNVTTWTTWRKKAMCWSTIPAAENCKIELSSRMSSRVRIPAACVIDGKPEEIDETISREFFENLTKDLLEKTHAPLEQVLRDAGIGKADIDHVILVGGSTRMPMVARDIREFFGKEPLSEVHPDYRLPALPPDETRAGFRGG